MSEPRAIPAVILCGGKSRRMGRPKALERFGTSRLLDHVAAVVGTQAQPVMINSNDHEITIPGLVTFADKIAGFMGPLAGIHASLLKTQDLAPGHSHVLVVPVDCPFLPANLVAKLSAAINTPHSVVIAGSRGQSHPVVGLWPVALAEPLQQWLHAATSPKVSTFLAEHSVATMWFADRQVPGGSLDPFFNINTPDDLAFARQIYELMTSEGLADD